MCPTLVALLLAAAPAGMARVGPGTVRPPFSAPGEAEIPVAAFQLDREPVTNAAFLAFVRREPRWRRDQVPRLFADAGYLAAWAGPARLGPTAPAEAPVVGVSWFAARAYCQARGARLPTEAEWELAAAADETRRDATRDPAFLERIVAWYGQPTPAVLPPVGRGQPNAWGVADLHGLVWEWVLDFGGATAGDERGEAFCGAGASATGDKQDYASFMRAAFRSSLQASFTTRNLGFRCARDLAGATP